MISAASSAKASMAGGVTCSGKAFVSQCAPKAPIGVTFRQKVLRYQRTAYFVLNRGVGGAPIRSRAGGGSEKSKVPDRGGAGAAHFLNVSPAWIPRQKRQQNQCLAGYRPDQISSETAPNPVPTPWSYY
jgi:hypothetical protein